MPRLVDDLLSPGDVRVFERGSRRSLVLAIGAWAERDTSGHIQIHLTGGETFHTTVTNNPDSERYHRTLFRNFRRLLLEHDRWPFGEEGAETEERGN